MNRFTHPGVCLTPEVSKFVSGWTFALGILIEVIYWNATQGCSCVCGGEVTMHRLSYMHPCIFSNLNHCHKIPKTAPTTSIEAEATNEEDTQIKEL